MTNTLFAIGAVILGLGLLVWSADRFVDGAAALARHFRLPPLLIGMVVIGIGTSLPELLVGTLAALENSPGIVLGNAYGSNISNIGLILGVSALLAPLPVHRSVLRRELPLLAAISGLALFQASDGTISRIDAGVLIAVFLLLFGQAIRIGLQRNRPGLEEEFAGTVDDVPPMSLKRAVIMVLIGLVLMIVASRLLVWGAVSIARGFGIDETIIGLTIVAIGTSLPELAAAIIAGRRGNHDLATGNVLGSNLFNTLAVVGAAGLIRPVTVDPAVLSRDMPVMIGFTLLLFLLGHGWRRQARIDRRGGAVLLAGFIAYTAWLVITALRTSGS